jgi:hypothetical protein
LKQVVLVQKITLITHVSNILHTMVVAKVDIAALAKDNPMLSHQNGRVTPLALKLDRGQG